MALQIDLSTTDKRVYDNYTYPENDTELKQRALTIAGKTVERFNNGGDFIEIVDELYAVTHELRLRGYEVSIDVESAVLTVE